MENLTKIAQVYKNKPVNGSFKPFADLLFFPVAC